MNMCLLKNFDYYTLNGNALSHKKSVKMSDIENVKIMIFNGKMDLVNTNISVPMNVETLVLHNCNLCTLPNDLPDRITRLDISNNAIEHISHLPKNLQKLNVSNNRLTELPPLPKTLKKLMCPCNQLTYISNLPNDIYHLLCVHNKINKIDLENCTSIKILYCHDNKLTNIYLPRSLEIVSLRNNNNLHIECIHTYNMIYLDCNHISLNILVIYPELEVLNLWCDNKVTVSDYYSTYTNYKLKILSVNHKNMNHNELKSIVIYNKGIIKTQNDDKSESFEKIIKKGIILQRYKPNIPNSKLYDIHIDPTLKYKDSKITNVKMIYPFEYIDPNPIYYKPNQIKCINELLYNNKYKIIEQRRGLLDLCKVLNLEINKKDKPKHFNITSLHSSFMNVKKNVLKNNNLGLYFDGLFHYNNNKTFDFVNDIKRKLKNSVDTCLNIMYRYLEFINKEIEFNRQHNYCRFTYDTIVNKFEWKPFKNLYVHNPKQYEAYRLKNKIKDLYILNIEIFDDMYYLLLVDNFKIYRTHWILIGVRNDNKLDIYPFNYKDELKELSKFDIFELNSSKEHANEMILTMDTMYELIYDK